MAQLVARTAGGREVAGSSPVTPTMMLLFERGYMGRETSKKILSSYFNEILSGNKTYELRLADWECEEGDILVLEELDDTTHKPTGRTLRRRVGYVGKTKGLSFWTKEQIEENGFQIISLLDDAEL